MEAGISDCLDRFELVVEFMDSRVIDWIAEQRLVDHTYFLTTGSTTVATSFSWNDPNFLSFGSAGRTADARDLELLIGMDTRGLAVTLTGRVTSPAPLLGRVNVPGRTGVLISSFWSLKGTKETDGTEGRYEKTISTVGTESSEKL